MANINKGIYQHYKGPYYEVLGIAKHEETREEMVVYRAPYGKYQLWVRSVTIFLEPVKLAGVHVPGFKFISD